MTLVVGMMYNKGRGSLIVSDSRIMVGNDYSVKQKLFYVILNEVVLGASGYNELRNRLIREVQKKIVEREPSDLYQLMDYMEDVAKEIHDRYTVSSNPFLPPKLGSSELLIQAIVGGIDESEQEAIPHLFVLHENGYYEEIDDYRAIGDGERHANNIIKSLYDSSMNKERALQLGIHAIVQTAKIDSAVDSFPQIAILDRDGCRIMNVDAQGFHDTIPQIEEMKKQINGVAVKQSELFDLWLNGSDEIKLKISDVFEDWKGKKKELA